MPITVNDPSVELEILFIDDMVEEMFDALECKKHHCEFDGVNTLLTENGRYCAAPVTHKATLGYIVACLHRFHDQPQMLVMPEIPNGSFEKKLYSMYLSYLPKEKVAFSLRMNLDAHGSFTELLKTKKCGQVIVNISKPGITKGQHWHNSKWEFFIVVSGHGLIQERSIGSDECSNLRSAATRSKPFISSPATHTTSSICPIPRTWLQSCGQTSNLTRTVPIPSARQYGRNGRNSRVTFKREIIFKKYKENDLMENKKLDPSALFQIGYGLYVITTRDGDKDNGCIVNTVMQITSNPLIVAVGINKQNYSCDIVLKTGKLNVNCLTQDTPFEVFRNFGYQSGRDTDKFGTEEHRRSDNGLIVLSEHVGAFLSLTVEQSIDLGSHILFLCSVSESRVIIPRANNITYSYYQSNVKPKPQAQEQKKKGFVCKICGYVYEGDTLPEDFVCPICKHGAEDFEPLK